MLQVVLFGILLVGAPSVLFILKTSKKALVLPRFWHPHWAQHGAPKGISQISKRVPCCMGALQQKKSERYAAWERFRSLDSPDGFPRKGLPIIAQTVYFNRFRALFGSYLRGTGAERTHIKTNAMLHGSAIPSKTIKNTLVLPHFWRPRWALAEPNMGHQNEYHKFKNEGHAVWECSNRKKASPTLHGNAVAGWMVHRKGLPIIAQTVYFKTFCTLFGKAPVPKGPNHYKCKVSCSRMLLAAAKLPQIMRDLIF